MDSKRKHLLIAVVIGLVVAYLNNWYLNVQSQQSDDKDRQEYVRVTKTIQAGTAVTNALVKAEKVPKKFAPGCAVRWGDLDSYIGQEVATTLNTGDYLCAGAIKDRLETHDKLAEQLDDGGQNMRAINLPVDETNSLARSIVTGDRIDIILLFTVPLTSQKMSAVLMQKVPVIATGTYSVSEQDRGVRRYNSLTLKVSAEQAVALNYARQVGKISIMLRGTKDPEIVQLSPISSVADILSPADREIVQKVIAQSRPQGPDPDKFRDQVKEIFELQRKQSLGK